MIIQFLFSQEQSQHHILESQRGARLPLKGDCTNPDRMVLSIISHLDVHMEIFLLQITKTTFIPHHMERGTTIQVPHTSHHYVGHTCNESEVKLEL